MNQIATQTIRINLNRIYNEHIYPNLKNKQKNKSVKNKLKRKFPLDRREFMITIESLSLRLNSSDIAELFKKTLEINFHIKYNIGNIYIIKVVNTKDYWIFNLTTKNIDLIFKKHIQKNILINSRNSAYLGSYNTFNIKEISCILLNNEYFFKNT